MRAGDSRTIHIRVIRSCSTIWIRMIRGRCARAIRIRVLRMRGAVRVRHSGGNSTIATAVRSMCSIRVVRVRGRCAVGIMNGGQLGAIRVMRRVCRRRATVRVGGVVMRVGRRWHVSACLSLIMNWICCCHLYMFENNVLF